MIKSVQNKPVSELFSFEANWKFNLSRYQREYVWRRECWENLFDDLLENHPGHFLGSMICINRSDDTIQAQELEVVDGQQRLVTLSLLYAAIYSCLGKCDTTDDEVKQEMFNLRHRLIFKNSKKDLRLELSLQGQDYADYRAILQDAGILGGVDVPANIANRRLFKVYRFFIDRLNELDNKGKRVFGLKRIQELLGRVNQSSMIKIEVRSHADAFTVLESLNNRGTPLC